MKIKHVLLAAVLMGSISATAKDYHYTTVPGDAMKTRIYTLDNGLTVYMSVNKEKPRLQANIAVKTGSRNDPAETTGLAHYLEHLMFKGTQKFGTIDHAKEKPYLDEITRRYESYRKLTDPAQRKQAYHEIDSVSQLAAKYNIPNEYDKLMSSIGSQGTNAYTSNDVTCYVENIPNNEIENWAKVQSDRFQNMVIRGFHTELEAVYEEKNISMASDNDKEFAASGSFSPLPILTVPRPPSVSRNTSRTLASSTSRTTSTATMYLTMWLSVWQVISTQTRPLPSSTNTSVHGRRATTSPVLSSACSRTLLPSRILP